MVHRQEGYDSALLFAFVLRARGVDLVILQKKVAGLNEDALDRFVLRARKAVGLRARVNVLITSSGAVRELNRQFRGQNSATDVLSFPSTSSASKARKRAMQAGDVAISADIARENSIRLGHSISQEIKILALHGILHLAGFDHERDNGAMARKEATLRRALRLPAALIERVKTERVKILRVEPERTRPGRVKARRPRAAGARRPA